MTRIDSVAFKRILDHLPEALQKKHNQKVEISFFFSSMVTFITFHFSWERGSTEDDNFLSM